MELIKRVWLLVVKLIVLGGWWCCDCCLEHERNALLQFKASFNHPNGTSLTSWVAHSDCCNWDKIECNPNTGRVIGIYLFHARDSSLGDWYLNATLFLPFEELNSLYLEENRIAGCIDNEGFERLSILPNLEILDLSNNNFNNSILSSLGDLSSLQSLFLSNNSLKGMINIEEWNNLTNLEMLYIGSNEIEGFQFLQDIRGLNNLNTLDLSYLNINGTSLLLKQSLRIFPNLRTIHLEGNDFEGTTFPQENNFINLQELYLDECSLDDNFLWSLRALPSLKILHLTRLNGTVPIQGLLNLHKLELLDLQWNQNLDGNILQKIGAIRSLKTLYLNDCGLNGNIPTIGGLCALEHLQDLDISYNNLSDNLPWCLANLSSLQHLDLSYNFFSGNISLSPLTSLISIETLLLRSNHFQIPFSLGSFFNHSKLIVFDAWGNEIFAETEVHNIIPRFQLYELYLCHHGYGGPLPKFLYYQHDLFYLKFRNFEIGGEFPYWLLDNNTELEYLFLVNTSLSGPLQLPIHHHLQLSELDISNNRFDGQIPTEFGAYFPKLIYLNMSANDLQGSIPISFGNISTLEWLHISDNQFTVAVPNSLSKCSSLKILDASNNRLSRVGWIGNMSSLEVLDLSNNIISRSLPSSFAPPKIKEIHFSNNGLIGLFPRAFFNCVELTVLDISHNYLTGGIPDWMGRFSQLNFLLLNNNNLKGEIPIQLCKLNQLNFIDLSHNDLSGPILPCLRSSSGSNMFANERDTQIGMFEGQEEFSMQPLQFTTKSISYFYHGKNLRLISGIDLSCNNFIGEIPHEIGNLIGMQFLNLSHNNLIGSIPPTFSNLSQILSLDLSYNKLTGSIPPELTQLSFLEVFSVAHNNLSGRTPAMVVQFATFDASSYKENPLLCGLPLPKSCTDALPPSSIHPVSNDEEESNSFMDINAFYVTFVVAYITVLLAIAAILCINPRWRQTWFYFIEVGINNCYYFVVDNLPVPSRFRLLTRI